MSRGTRIVAIEEAEPASSSDSETVQLPGEPEGGADADWWEEPDPRPAQPWLVWIGAAIALGLVEG